MHFSLANRAAFSDLLSRNQGEESKISKTFFLHIATAKHLSCSLCNQGVQFSCGKTDNKWTLHNPVKECFSQTAEHCSGVNCQKGKLTPFRHVEEICFNSVSLSFSSKARRQNQDIPFANGLLLHLHTTIKIPGQVPGTEEATWKDSTKIHTLREPQEWPSHWGCAED